MAARVSTYPVIRQLPDEYYPLIGKIMVDWSYLENLLRDSVYMLLHLDRKKGRIAVRSPRANEMITMIEELLDASSLSTKAKTKEIKKALTTVSAARDALAHGLWIKHDQTEIPVLQVVSGSFPVEEGKPSAKARLTPIAMATTPADLGKTLQDIRNLTGVIERLKDEIEGQTGPLPEIPQERRPLDL